MTGKLWLMLLLGAAPIGVRPSVGAADEGPSPADSAAMRAAVLADWDLQEKRLGRSPHSPEAIQAAAKRGALLLGTVPVEADGSAYFQAPARKPLYFQAVDEAGRAVQGMRSVVYLQPGERRGCVGCHEPVGASPAARPCLAALRSPSTLEPGPDGTRPFGFVRLIQPILDRRCVRCHDGSTGPDKARPDLRDGPAVPFSKSYDGLKPYLRWPSYDGPTRPGELGADASPLAAILVGPNHGKHVELPDHELRTIYLWLDAQVPFFGTYEDDALDAQRRGHAISPPSLQ
ncbi:MAG: hypothetical protein FJ297_13370 [Planctomycetes bacterium]|nr:hypothetical protein [Planctomycetota bacterium]